MVNDFYVDRGQLFIHNDVNFSGTNALIYRSTVPSFITSKSNLNFDIGTTFDFRPSTTGTPQLLAKDLLKMQNATSQLYLNGCTLKTTTTGFRLTKGQLIFDNKISLTSAAQLQLKSTLTWFCKNYGNAVNSVNWSPDGRYLAVSGDGPTSGHDEVEIYKFNGSSLTLVTSKNYGSYAYSANWSPDGRYLAVGGFIPTSGNEIQVFSFDGSALTLVASQNYGSSSSYISSVNWSPDGRYLAISGVGGEVGHYDIEVYRFNGAFLTLSTYINSSYEAQFAQWSPDGKYLATCFYTAGTDYEVKIYVFNESSLNLVASRSYGAGVYCAKWSNDGRFLAIGGYSPTNNNELQIYNFNGSSLTLVASKDYGYYAYTIDWSPDGRYVAIGGTQPTSTKELQFYSFNGSSLTLVSSQVYGTYLLSLHWSRDGKYLAVGGQTPTAGNDELEIYTLQYGPETQTQAISNSIIFGNSTLGSSYDLNVRGLSNAKIEIDGLINYDNVI